MALRATQTNEKRMEPRMNTNGHELDLSLV